MFVQDRFYRLVLSDGTGYVLIREPLKNGANRTIAIDSYARRAVQDTTTGLTASHWTEVIPSDIPTELLTKINARLV